MTEKTAFEKVQLARHPDRPYTLDLLSKIFDDFVELHGDRRFSDDAAVVSGFACIGDYQVAVIGHQKGRDMQSRQRRNFGMPKPEGYRKALRVMKIAEKFSRPVITFIDTPGAYPGIDAEERGQAEAIAYNLREMSLLKTPVIIVVIGEGGSGGALAIGVGDRILMMENAIYSVISPEGCAAILWKDVSFAPKAAETLRLTAKDLLELGVVDEVISEGEGWFCSDSEDAVSTALKQSILRHLSELSSILTERLLELRYEKFRKMGRFLENSL